MKFRLRSLTLASAIALSTVSLGSVIAQTPSPKDACSSVRVPKDMSCMISPKTGKPVVILTACGTTAAAMSLPFGVTLKSFEGGFRLNNGPVCKIDPKTDLPIAVPQADRPLKKQ